MATVRITAERAAAIDRYGELRRRIKEFAPIREEYDELTKEIESWFEDKPAEKKYLIEGELYEIQVGARENKSRVIDKEYVFRKLGREFFLATAIIPLEDLRRAVPKELWPKFIVTERTGRRRLDPVLNQPAAKAPAA